MNELNEVKKIDSINSLQKLAKMKEIKTKIEETNDNNVLNNMEKEIDNNIKSELENYKNTLYGFPESPKLVKLKTHKIIQNGMEYDEFNNDNSNSIIIEEFNKWISIESQLMNLINEWIKYKHSKKEYMTKSREVLDDCIYGQEKAKNSLIEILAKWVTNPSAKGNIIGLCGPPGVGKTSLVKNGLATSIKMPFSDRLIEIRKGLHKLLFGSEVVFERLPSLLLEITCTVEHLRP